ncbi:Uncharacterized protein APZ42_025731 [Daphnia magna]|uniref:Uncharacterized protein n=1 Tax=Daphnia magna TaxID=35525 RepID=A0A164STM6_9CRUS|nr:Uncharacterized protein APZ42_025731 [Daphnia magna]
MIKSCLLISSVEFFPPHFVPSDIVQRPFHFSCPTTSLSCFLKTYPTLDINSFQIGKEKI